MMQPNRYTELFFLDEATALAAGHRPCFECRRQEAETLRRAVGAHEGAGGAPQRRRRWTRCCTPSGSGPTDKKYTFRARLADLPAGAFVRYATKGSGARPYLVVGSHLLAVGSSRLRDGDSRSRPSAGEVDVLTPRSIVAVLSAGYCPMLHPSAAALLG